jgi:hypothetical protein
MARTLDPDFPRRVTTDTKVAEFGCVVGSIPWSRPGSPAGSTPPDRTDPIPVGQIGQPGILQIKDKLTFAELVPCVSPSHVNMMLNASIRDYINEQCSDALSRLVWLKGVITTILQLPDTAKPPEADLQRYRPQARLVDMLILQLKLGLDYYAEPVNRVPLVSVDYYNGVIQQLLTYGNHIETSYFAYQNAANDQKAAGDAFRATMTQALQSINQMQAQSAQLAAQQGPLSQTIARLSDALNGVWVELMGAEQKFREAIQNKGQGCNFAQIVAIGASVATLIGSGGTAAVAIGVAMKALQKEPLQYDDKNPVSDDFKGFQYKVNTLVTVGKDVSSFTEAYTVLKTSLQPKTVPGSNVPALPGDEAKIVASADDIESQLKPFLDLTEAREYQSLLQLFVATAEARNNKILEFNNILVAWYKLQATITQTQLEADAAQTSYASTQNPFIPDAMNFMHKAWVDSKTNIISVLYQLNRAYQYYSLNTSPFAVSDFSMAAIENTAQASLSLYTAALAGFGSQPANIRGKDIDLLPYITKIALEKFKKTKIIHVAISPKDQSLLAYSNLLATRVGLKVKGPTGEAKYLQVNITHEGRSLIFDQTGRSHTFSHVAITTPYEVQAGHVVSDGAIAIDKDYVGVSPYGPWTIHINSVDQSILDHMQGLALTFDGKGRARA